MAQLTRAALETFFETDDKPSSATFTNFFDSYGNLLDDGVLVGGVAGIVAFAGGGQAGATQLTARVNRVATVASANDSVKLPTAVPGHVLFLKHAGANTLGIFPSSGDQIQALGVNTGLFVFPGASLQLQCALTGQWD